MRALDIFLGRAAARQIRETGWNGADVELLLGASGGPKWLILGHLDRVLFSRFLTGNRSQPLRAVGSSVGSWRHACAAQEDPRRAIDRFEDIYVHWEYSDRPEPEEISRASAAMLGHILGDSGAGRLLEHPWLHSYIITARGRGPTASRGRAMLGSGMAAAAVANGLHRKLLSGLFQRVVFATPGARPLPCEDFNTAQVGLSQGTVTAALHASGSIPFVLSGERDISGAPPGQYWDGGIIDYHFEPEKLAGNGLILYPHFRADLTTGWFDKFLPWRRHRSPQLDHLILLCPSRAFIASLPQGKIPDRSDFSRLSVSKRLDYWRQCIDRSRQLADEFAELLESPDPLRGVRVLE